MRIDAARLKIPAMGLRNSMYMMEQPTQTNASTNRIYTASTMTRRACEVHVKKAEAKLSRRLALNDSLANLSLSLSPSQPETLLSLAVHD